ncbi:hypothetical protein D3C85_1266460 [compost metagenome]
MLKHIEHQIAPLERPLRIATRVVIRRALDHAHQHCDLMQLQFRQWLPEEELAGQTETMHRPLTILADEHFIEVGLKNFSFVVMQL